MAFLPKLAMVYMYVFGANPRAGASRKILAVHILDVIITIYSV